MADLKSMYKTIVKETFPDDLTITLGSEKLVYRKRQWELAGELKGLRYGENPDQPAALYELVDGAVTLG
ncbi:MAG: IMP cyclohydrolase, partial [Desulfovibrio sp.]|nr:IMP cyclohydrolase [Desulfovibrio sp.]